ncbi:5856_t:CDS:10 [Entrophospora sp. SA101]|nr:5856_t:CDS:10 [Entrophospora sp. SA101]
MEPTFTSPLLGRVILLNSPSHIEWFLKRTLKLCERQSINRTEKRIVCETWKFYRKITNNLFIAKNFREIFCKVFEQETKTVLNILNDTANKDDTIDLQDLFFRFTLNTFGKISFGIDMKCLEQLSDPLHFAIAFDYVQQFVSQPQELRMLRLTMKNMLEKLEEKDANISNNILYSKQYQNGEIVCIELNNFMTYELVEFRPDPNLNLIIGPNESRNGQDHASIKIEFKHDDDNVIIICLITRADNRTQWTLNGEKTTLENIQSIVESFNIQMTPPELLIQTEEMVGEKELLEFHKSLIKLSEQKNLLSESNTDNDELNNLEKINAVLKKDVTHFKEREAILRKIQLYQAKISSAQYSLAGAAFDLQCEIDLSKSIKEKEIFLEETLCEIARKKSKTFNRYQNLTQVLKDDGELGRQIQEKKDILRQTSDRLGEVTRRFDEIEEKMTYHCQESDKLINKLDDVTRAELQEISQKMTLEEIRNAIDHEKENINLYNEVDPNIIDSYNERQAQVLINNLYVLSQKEKRELSLKELNNEIAKENEQWEPKLYELVRKIGELFSNAFNKIRCTGEVHINTHEDYDKWERSVSTIMYLMALQELAKTPFCVVEINQGMDPKNEYLVHNHMIETSCHQPSQYFLITSELLSDCDLKYNAFTMLCFIIMKNGNLKE